MVQLEALEEITPKMSKCQEMIKLRAETNKIKHQQQNNTIQRFSETNKKGSLRKINRIDKHLAKLTKRQRENMHINRIRYKRGH